MQLIPNSEKLCGRKTFVRELIFKSKDEKAS